MDLVATDSELTLFICSMNCCGDSTGKPTPVQLTWQSAAIPLAIRWVGKDSNISSRKPISATF